MLVKKHGIDNILIMDSLRPLRTFLGLISYTSSNDDPVEVPCKIVEDRYKVADGYKVTIKPLYESFGTENYYQTDFNTLVERGSIKVFVKVPDDFEKFCSSIS